MRRLLAVSLRGKDSVDERGVRGAIGPVVLKVWLVVTLSDDLKGEASLGEEEGVMGGEGGKDTKLTELEVKICAVTSLTCRSRPSGEGIFSLVPSGPRSALVVQRIAGLVRAGQRSVGEQGAICTGRAHEAGGAETTGILGF